MDYVCGCSRPDHINDNIVESLVYNKVVYMSQHTLQNKTKTPDQPTQFYFSEKTNDAIRINIILICTTGYAIYSINLRHDRTRTARAAFVADNLSIRHDY